MKIIVDGIPAEKGGIGTLLVNMAEYGRRFTDQNIVFEFLVPENSEYKTFLIEHGYSYYEVPRLSHLRSYLHTIKTIFKKNEYDFIWINNTSKINLFLPFFAKKYAHARVIAHVHGVQGEEQGLKKVVFSFLTGLLGKQYEKMVDIPFACSEAAAKYFYQDKQKLARCEVIKNGIFTNVYQFDEQVRREMRRQLGMTEDQIVLGAVGRLTRVKNYTFLIQLMSHLPESYQCIILGEGEDREELTKEIQTLHLEKRVHLLGNQSEVHRYLCAMDVFVMPSLNEGMPYSIIEAQASGLHCIASDGISTEVNITGNVQFISLEDTEKWVTEITKCNKKLDREKQLVVIEEKGFSIGKSYEKLVMQISKFNSCKSK